MDHVLVIDSHRSDYLEGLAIEREVFGAQSVVELARVAHESEIDGRLEAADVVISWHAVPLGAGAFSRMQRCRGVVRAAVGYDNIDLESARAAGIPVANVPDYGTEEVADHAMALLLSMARNLEATRAATERGVWDWRSVGVTRRLRGTRLGLVGFGRIGMAVAQRARVFGMACSFYDPLLLPGIEKALAIERAPTLRALMGASDVVSIHTPSHASTRGLIGRVELAAMPHDGMLINTARGDVVDQAALIEHLAGHPRFRAALDVLAREPEIPLALRGNAQVVMSGHSAFYSPPALVEMRSKSAQTARRLLHGEPVPTLVNGPFDALASARRVRPC